MVRPQRVQVGVPTPADDRPKLGRVGVIMALCFGAGIAWPRLAEVTLVQRAPSKDPREVTAAETMAGLSAPTASAAPAVPPPPPAESAAAAEPAATSPPPSELIVHLERSLVASCQGPRNHKLPKAECDKPNLDPVVLPALKSLVGCRGAQGASGVLSIGIEVDFGGSRIRNVVRGRTTTLSEGQSLEALHCLERELKSATLNGIAHRHDQYWSFYVVRLTPR